MRQLKDDNSKLDKIIKEWGEDYEGTKPIEDFEKIHDENNAARVEAMLHSSEKEYYDPFESFGVGN